LKKYNQKLTDRVIKLDGELTTSRKKLTMYGGDSEQTEEEIMKIFSNIGKQVTPDYRAECEKAYAKMLEEEDRKLEARLTNK
jgi:hypothetical protein